MTIQTQIIGFIDGVHDAIEEIVKTDLPLVGDDLKNASSQILDFLDDIKTAINSSGGPSTAQAIADAINQAIAAAPDPTEGVTAAVDPGDPDNVILTFASHETITVDLLTAPIQFGTSVLDLDVQAKFDAIIEPHLNLSLSINTTDGTVALVDTNDKEISVDVGIAVDISNGSGGPAEATLGSLLEIKLTDNVPVATPELGLNFGLNLHSLDFTGVEASASGNIDLNLGIETNLSDLLPTISTDLVIHYGFDDSRRQRSDIPVPECRDRPGLDSCTKINRHHPAHHQYFQRVSVQADHPARSSTRSRSSATFRSFCRSCTSIRFPTPNGDQVLNFLESRGRSRPVSGREGQFASPNSRPRIAIMEAADRAG